MPIAEPHLSYAPMRYFRAIIPSIASLIVWPFFFQLVLSEFRTTKKLICSFFLNVGRRSEEKIRQVGRHKAWRQPLLASKEWLVMSGVDGESTCCCKLIQFCNDRPLKWKFSNALMCSSVSFIWGHTVSELAHYSFSPLWVVIPFWGTDQNALLFLATIVTKKYDKLP